MEFLKWLYVSLDYVKLVDKIVSEEGWQNILIEDGLHTKIDILKIFKDL